MSEKPQAELWIPDHDDGSGWADVDWVSAARGSRYSYRHAEADAEARALRPRFYRIVTRLDTPLLHAPHENSYYVPSDRLADFLAELVLAGGDEMIWHIEPCNQPPTEANIPHEPHKPVTSY
ncbi:MAG: hypothetical protein IT335_09900 [Thermomicrobiales bacterium]|nr:hypothetical protein [Thermomicrobiales bacterium]